MKKSAALPVITTRLLDWYKEHKRDLPWRETTDVYSVWISEVILQQTRVAQGSDYYVRFMRRFPNVRLLAEADEQEVLKLWQGLGYYSRARNMHTAAKQIVSRFNGRFPSHYSDILSLKGIGAYTAAAISSIAFNEPFAVVDGNVFRVIARLFAIETPIHTSDGKKTITEIAQQLIDRDHPGTYNQGIMDFGAVICTPRQPKCADCPLQSTCMAYSLGRVFDFPVINRKINIKNRYFNYFHIVDGDKTYLQKRDHADIWKNLYEFPLIETSSPADFMQLEQMPEFRELFSGIPSLSVDYPLTLKHQLTHQVIHTHFYRVTIPEQFTYRQPGKVIEIEKEKLSDYPISRLTHKYLETI